MSVCTKCGCEVDDMALCCPGCLSDNPMNAKADKARRLAMLADNLDENERLFREGKRDGNASAF